MRKYIAIALLSFHSAMVVAAELTLFDVPLRTASREEIQKAITKAGGKLESSSRDIDQYDAKAIGLPGATNLEVVYLENRLVMAQYSLTQHPLDKEELLRKMLVSKYGQPKAEGSFGPPSRAGGFDGQYVSDGKYRWKFERDMELVFTKSWGGRDPNFLSYVNKKEQDRLGRIVKETDRRAADKAAAAKKSVF